MCLLCLFHFLEFLSTALFQPDSLGYECEHTIPVPHSAVPHN